jgi:hypothetical protein
MQLVAAHKADSCDEPQLLSDRREGRCVLSYQTPGGWVAITKAILTEVLGAGRDAKIVGLPPAAAGVLTLMCPDLVSLETFSPQRSASSRGRVAGGGGIASAGSGQYTRDK